MTQITLTPENAHKVATVISKNNPEWGSKRFEYKAQILNEGRFAHVVGVGCNSSVLFESEMKFWNVETWK